MRSPTAAIGNSIMATVKPYALTIQTTEAADSFKSFAIAGKATLDIEASSTDNIKPIPSAKAALRRRPVGKPSIASGARAVCASDMFKLF
jgi:hypothetical protein